MAAYDDLDNKRIFSVAFISVFVTAVTALAVQVLYYTMVQWQQAETAAASDYRRQDAFLEEQSDEISTYGVNPETGSVVIPVEQAIDFLVKEKSDSSAAGDEKSEKPATIENASDET